LINLTKENPTQTMIGHSGYFGISVLNEHQQEISNLFTGFGKCIQDRFSVIDTFTMESGVPLIKGGVSHLDCRVYDRCELPNSVVFIGEVVAGDFNEKSSPLLYFNRDYAELCQPLKSETDAGT